MDYANKKDIEWLLYESKISSYRIEKETGIKQGTLNRYRRKNEAKIDNMSFAIAITLQEFYNKLKEDGEVIEVNREELFGKTFATLNALGEMVFEKNKPSVEVKYFGDIINKPMTTIFRAHRDVMQYTSKFKKDEMKLFDKLTEYIDKLSVDSFTDKPLAESFIVYFSRESVKLRKPVN